MTESFFDTDPTVNDFVTSMPDAYREVFDARSRREHTALVSRRGNRAGFADVWRTLPRGLAVLCVVGDDHPGLLSVVTTALVLHRLDVVTAQVFCRRIRGGGLEAVDFFWVRREERASERPPAAEHLERCVGTITGFLRAGVEPDDITGGLISAPPPGPPPRVYWTEAAPHGDSVLCIEATDGPGLLMALAKALYQCELSIVGSNISTEDGIARDRFMLRTRHLSPLDEVTRARTLEQVERALHAWHDRALLRTAG
jgi:UTP:GlnB (protein PII) uridylyltransferase